MKQLLTFHTSGRRKLHGGIILPASAWLNGLCNNHFADQSSSCNAALLLLSLRLKPPACDKRSKREIDLSWNCFSMINYSGNLPSNYRSEPEDSLREVIAQLASSCQQDSNAYLEQELAGQYLATPSRDWRTGIPLASAFDRSRRTGADWSTPLRLRSNASEPLQVPAHDVVRRNPEWPNTSSQDRSKLSYFQKFHIYVHSLKGRIRHS